jgi:hypothetical protein
MYQYMARNAGRCLQRKKPESLLFRRSAWRWEEQTYHRIPETIPDRRIWRRIREEDSGARASRKSKSTITRRRNSASQEMRRKKTQNRSESIPTDSKQTSIRNRHAWYDTKKKGKENSDEITKNTAIRCASESICLRWHKQRSGRSKSDWRAFSRQT